MGISPLGSFDVSSFPGVKVFAIGIVDDVEHRAPILATDAGAPTLIWAMLLIQTPHELVDPVAGTVGGVSRVLGIPDNLLCHQVPNVRRGCVREATSDRLSEAIDLALQALLLLSGRQPLIPQRATEPVPVGDEQLEFRLPKPHVVSRPLL